MIRCSVCHQGTLLPTAVDHHDLSALVGLDQVVLVRGRALQCDQCAALALDGAELEEVLSRLARLVVQQEELLPKEVRFLRELLGMTQGELAERLGVTRVTVTRWEASDVALGSIPSLALRTLAAWHLDDPDLAREIGAPNHQRRQGRFRSRNEVSLPLAV